MTREEQRHKAAKEYAERWYKELGTSVDEFPTDAQITIDEFTKGAEWADSHPNWCKVDEELPPPISAVENFSNSVIVTDGCLLCKGYYNYTCKSWEVEGDIDSNEVTHWMYLPDFPQKN